MFSTLEDEVVGILQANLPVPSTSVVAGPTDPPSAGQRPRVAFTADAFEVLPEEEAGPPGGVKEAVEDTFPAGEELLVLSRRPLEPLRAVEVEDDGGRVLLRERDDYTVNYLEGRLRLRRTPADPVHVRYFALRPLEVVAATRLRVEGRLEVWADDAGALATAAMGALAANAGAFDGLASAGEDVPSSGLPSLGERRVFVIFEGLVALGGEEPEPGNWRVDYAADATLVLVPAEGEVGIMRYIAAGLAWDDRLAELLHSTPPPILGRPVEIVLGVGPVLAATLSGMGILTVGELATAAPTGQSAVDQARGQARVVRDRSREVVRRVVRSAPEIPDVGAFLALPLSGLEAADLTAVAVPQPAADQIVAAVAAILAATTAADLAFSDLFFSLMP